MITEETHKIISGTELKTLYPLIIKTLTNNTSHYFTGNNHHNGGYNLVRRKM